MICLTESVRFSVWQICGGEEKSRDIAMWGTKKGIPTPLSTNAEPQIQLVDRARAGPAFGKEKHFLQGWVNPSRVDSPWLRFPRGMPREDKLRLLIRISIVTWQWPSPHCTLWVQDLPLCSINYPFCIPTLPPSSWPHSVKKEDHGPSWWPDGGQRGGQDPHPFHLQPPSGEVWLRTACIYRGCAMHTVS